MSIDRKIYLATAVAAVVATGAFTLAASRLNAGVTLHDAALPAAEVTRGAPNASATPNAGVLARAL